MGDRITNAVWLAYMPQHTSSRGNQTSPVGAHAFIVGRSLSLCNTVPATAAGDPATSEARRCVLCKRVEEGKRPTR